METRKVILQAQSLEPPVLLKGVMVIAQGSALQPFGY